MILPRPSIQLSFLGGVRSHGLNFGGVPVNDPNEHWGYLMGINNCNE